MIEWAVRTAREVEPGVYTSLRLANHLEDYGLVASFGSTGDSYDCEYPQAGDPRLGGSPQPLLLAV
jgi:hypothetical protein